MIDRERALAIQRAAFRDWLAMLGGGSAGARVLDLGRTVRGSVVPAVPERSIVNSVTYEDRAELAAHLEELAAAYDAAGVGAWTVWCPEFDREAIELLERAGHSFDGQPMAMVCELDRLRPPDPGDLRWDRDGDMPTLGEINQGAYGIPPEDPFASAFASRPDGLDLRIYRALVDGEVACVLSTIDHPPVDGAGGPDCGVYFVATAAGHRGRGLATRLMAVALAEARERGCATSSLQASAMGEPIYSALGYESCFRIKMFERRPAKGSR